MKCYNAIRKMFEYSALIGAMAFAGCAAGNKMTVKMEQPKDTTESPIVVVEKEHPRASLAWTIYSENPSYAKCEQLDSIIKNTKLDTNYLLDCMEDIIWEKIYSEKKESAKPIQGQLAEWQKQSISLTFFVKSLEDESKKDYKSAIKNLDTAITFHPTEPQLYFQRGLLKYLAGEEDIESDYRLMQIFTKEPENKETPDKGRNKVIVDNISIITSMR
jgi:hypothetical protein